MNTLLQVLSLFLVSMLQLCYSKPPNIVFIVADDLGWNDVGWRNEQVLTPNLDKLAREGVILNSSYVQPVCTPSRNAFLTGYFPFHTGLQHFVIFPPQPYGLPLKFTLLPERLRKLGYDTHMVGKWHLGFCKWEYTPTYRGFDTFLGYYNGEEHYFSHDYTYQNKKGFDLRNNTKPLREATGDYSANIYATRAIEILENHNKSKPLFLYLPFQSVHAPLEVPERYKDLYPAVKTEARRTYLAMVSALDEAVGNITDTLKKYGYMDDTLIVFTTDNGGPVNWGANNWPLRGAKVTLWEGGTKASAFVHGPMLKKRGYTNTGMIHAVDWYATLLSIAGGKVDPDVDGIDQWDTISSDAPSKRKRFVYNIDEIDDSFAIREGDYKLMVGNPGNYNGWYPLPRLNSDIPTEDNLTIKNQLNESVMLFNIKDDPTEHFDLSRKLPEIRQKLLKRLAQYKKTIYPAMYPKPDPRSDPKFWDGTWSPGWC